MGDSVSVRKHSIFGRCSFRQNNMIKYTVFGPEDFPYFCLSPADKEAPEISNNKLQYHTKNACKRMCVFLVLLLESTDFLLYQVCDISIRTLCRNIATCIRIY